MTPTTNNPIDQPILPEPAEPLNLPTGTVFCKGCEYPLDKSKDHLYALDGFEYCSVCRSCTQCHVTISSMELDFILRNDLDLRHALCRLQTSSPEELFGICAKDIEFLNIARFCLIPDMNQTEEEQANKATLLWQYQWSEYTSNEQRFRHMRMLETLYKLAYTAVKQLGELPTVPTELSRKKIAQEVTVRESKQYKEIKEKKEKEESRKLKEGTPGGKAMTRFYKQMKSMNMTDDVIKQQWNLMNEDMPWNLY